MKKRMKKIKRKAYIQIIVAILITLFIFGGMGLLIYLDYEDAKDNIQHCKDKGYEGIYWEGVFYNDECYKYDKNDVMIIDKVRGLK